MFTIIALAAVPAFARGHVRDLRARWALEEVGLPYRVRTIDWKEFKSPGYRALQPFNQVPVLEEEGRAPIFESGAMLVAIAERAGALLPADGDARSRTLSWVFAALNSIEPFVAAVTEVDVFLRDEEEKTLRRPHVVKAAQGRLALLAEAIDGEWLAGDFSIADILMTTVLGIVDHTDLVTSLPTLAAYKARGEARPAYARAMAGQLADTKEIAPERIAKLIGG